MCVCVCGICVYVYVYVYMCMCVRVCVYAGACAHVCMFVYNYVPVCLCLWVCKFLNFIESLEIHFKDIFEILYHNRVQYVDKIHISQICLKNLILCIRGNFDPILPKIMKSYISESILRIYKTCMHWTCKFTVRKWLSPPKSLDTVLSFLASYLASYLSLTWCQSLWAS